VHSTDWTIRPTAYAPVLQPAHAQAPLNNMPRLATC